MIYCIVGTTSNSAECRFILLSLPVGLVQEFHTLAVKTAPVVAVKEKMQGLAEDPRRLLERLLKLFAQVHLCVQ